MHLLLSKQTKYKQLNWDSDFFGFKVGRIHQVVVDIASLNETLHSIEAESERSFQLLYLSNPTEIADLSSISANFKLKFVDRKITYSKELTKVVEPTNLQINSYQKVFPEPQLMQLAIQSGIYSRFNIDENIKQQQFEALYEQWMMNSVLRKMAKEVLTYHTKELSMLPTIAGMVTIKEINEQHSEIGIIAVEKGFRGQGIGKQLMTASENWSFKNGYQNLQVVTQGANLPACKLYESCGYQIIKVEYCYHLWRK